MAGRSDDLEQTRREAPPGRATGVDTVPIDQTIVDASLPRSAAWSPLPHISVSEPTEDAPTQTEGEGPGPTLPDLVVLRPPGAHGRGPARVRHR